MGLLDPILGGNGIIGGDLSEESDSIQRVVGLRGRALNTGSPTDGQVLEWNAASSTIRWVTPATTLSLPVGGANPSVYAWDGANMGWKDVPSQIVTVGKIGGDYQTIQAAINAITDASASKPYAVLVYPGVYEEQVTCKQWVSVHGVHRRDVWIRYGSTAGAIIMASECHVTDLSIDSSSTASHWGIVATNCSRIAIERVNILGDHAAHTQIAGGIKITGSSWVTCFVEDCILDYLGTTGDGIYLEGNATTPQNADCHIDNSFVDALYATTGKAIHVKDLFGVRICGRRHRATKDGYVLYLESSAGYVDAMVEHVTLEGFQGLAPLEVAVHTATIGNHCTLHRKYASITAVQALSGSTIRNYDNEGQEDRQILPSASFAWINQGSANGTSAAWTAPNGEWSLRQPGGTAVSWSLLVKSHGVSTPYVIDATIEIVQPNKEYIASGLILREFDSGKFYSFHYQGGGLFVAEYDGVDDATPTAIASCLFVPCGPLRLRFYVTGVEQIYAQYSPDGIAEHYLDLVTAYGMDITPDQLGFGVLGQNTTTPHLPACLRVKHIAPNHIT